MRVANRSDEFAAVQLESMQVAVELRKALGAVCRAVAPSPLQGGLPRPPSPARGAFVPCRVGIVPYVIGAASVSDRRNSRLP